MSLRLRLAITFAFVAVVTAAAISLFTPAIVDHGFQQFQVEDREGRGEGQGQGPGPREGRGPGRAQQDTTLAIVLVAVVAAAGASVLGFLVAGRLIAPLGRLQEAAAGVAAGDLGRRSGVGDRRDEIGDLGRSFDGMAEALDRSDAARRRMFQDAAHELKTPLTVIDATTTAILDGVYEHDDRHLETIRQQSHLLARTVDDLRTVSLAESGQMPLTPATLDVAEVLGVVVAGFEAPATLAGVTLGIDADPPKQTVYADRERLHQVLAALVDNALRHTPKGGTISVSARPDSEFVRLVVQDDGSGIAAEDLPHVFERFYRADPSRQRASGTSGLGLAIVAALVAAQGGTVGAEDAPGGGARFWVRLPSRA
jgi:two-component system sensor histidine kinase BaeS